MNDFDFFLGKEWTVTNTLLKERLNNSTEWTEFEAKLTDFKLIMNGYGNIDKMVATRNGVYYEASSLRIYNDERSEWSIYWMDNISQKLIPQVTGKFENGVGTFYGKEEYAGKAMKLRFLWTDISAAYAKWEQAYYDESRKEWETNWIMEFNILK
jgi:hypothetical protein